MCDTYHILPIDYEGSIQYESISVYISAKTTNDDYRCRDHDTRDIVVCDNNECLIYKDCKGYWYNISTAKSHINEDIGESISCLFNVECLSGKYPYVTVLLNENYYKVVSEEHDTDRGRAILDAEYSLKIHVF